MQILILRKKFKPIGLFQIFFVFVLGYFVDYVGALLKWIEVSNYFLQIVVLLLSCFFVALGIMLIITMDIMPGAPEGLILALSGLFKVPFAKTKVWFDCTSVTVAAILGLVFLGNIGAIREGTVISALIIGRIVGLISKPCKPWLLKIAFYDKAKATN